MPPKPPCGNPLFLEWLTDIYDKLKESEARSALTYKRACDSLRSCPIRYATPSELIHLRFIGPAIVQQLEMKQKEYCERQGLQLPVPIRSALPEVEAGPSRKKAKTSTGAAARRGDNHAGVGMDIDTDTDDSDLGDFSADGPGPEAMRAMLTAEKSNKRTGRVAAKRNADHHDKHQDDDTEQSDLGDFTAQGPGPEAMRAMLAARKSNKHPGRSAPKRKAVDHSSKDQDVGMHDFDLGDLAADDVPGPSRKKTTANTGTAAPPKTMTAPSKSKLYTPRIRSGAFAILITLLLRLPQSAQRAPTIQDDGEVADDDVVDLRDGWMSKSEIVAQAQEYCDVSMTQSETGGYHNGYSAMSTLNQKGLVYRQGNPARFRLTELGLETARSLLPHITPATPPAATPSTPKAACRAIAAAFPMDPPSSRRRRRTLSFVEENDLAGLDGETSGKQGKRPVPRADEFVFWYIGPFDKRVRHLELATCKINGELQMPVRKIEFPARLVNHLAASQLLEVQPKSAVLMVGWVLEIEAEPSCPGFETDEHVDRCALGDRDTNPALARQPLPRPASPSPIAVNDIIDLLSSPETPSHRARRTRTAVHVESPIVSLALHGERTERASYLPPSAPLPLAGPIKRDPPQLAASTSATSNNATRPRPKLAGHVLSMVEQETEQSDVDMPMAAAGNAGTNFNIQSAVKFPPGTYEIILIMDCRELHKKRDVDEMTKGLLNKGVKVEVRALQMGDVAWIARDVTGKHQGEETECVLDFVVERKRMDDLVGSIRDGRYDDQKLRLTNSCIRNVYYIIEDWDNARHRAESGQQIATAKSQTQIIDQCFVKETHTLKETIAFLKVMTDTISEMYQHETLYLIPSRFISRPNYVAMQKRLREAHPTKYFVTSFETYQAINSKSGNCTIMETFARMLMCVRGMTQEKVCLVLDVWQTPLAMWQAFKQRRVEFALEMVEERQRGPIRGKSKVRPLELFFADAVESRSARQKIGDSLSREMYAVFCA